jgi:hypothetical protein
MTQRPLILENTEDPWTLVDSPWGELPAWKVQGMAMGTGGALEAVHQLYQLVRNDAAEAAARADEAEARKSLVKHLCDQVVAMQERINRLADALEARERADAEAAGKRARFDQDQITLPPDILEHQTLSPPTPIESDETQVPGGELHSIAAKEEPSLQDADNIGDLPKELVDLPDPVPEPSGSVYPQPVSISLNEG